MSRTVVVLTVPGCHLCADAVVAVSEVCAAAGVAWSQQDLFELDDASVAKWRDLVPVVLVDAEVTDVLYVDRGRLTQRLN